MCPPGGLRLDDVDPSRYTHVVFVCGPASGDAPGSTARPDLAARVSQSAVPVVGVYLTGGQHEYGDRRRHEAVIGALTDWLGGLDAALLSLETRFDHRDWRLTSTPGQVRAVIARVDAVVTMRMHGLVLPLQTGVPAR